jgi:hypothetical protein
MSSYSSLIIDKLFAIKEQIFKEGFQNIFKKFQKVSKSFKKFQKVSKFRGEF